MTFKPSVNLEHLEPSATIAISQAAQQKKAAGEDVIDLGAGEPDFITPGVACEAGINAIKSGKTHYPPNQGILELRVAAAKSLSLMSAGRPVNPDNIVVSNGAKQAVFNACFTLFGPGDQVLIPTPAWVSYPQIVHLARAKPVPVDGDPEWSLKVSAKDLRAAAIKPAGLIFCSPSNPTGHVYTLREIENIAAWARDEGVWVIADEIYRRIHYGDGPAPSFLDLPDDLLERVVVVSGASKAYAMTGWRIGYSVAPPEVTRAIAALQSHTTSGASHPAQWAAAAALGDERMEPAVQKMIQDFHSRRNMIVDHFRRELPGVEFVEPMGAFYFFFRVDGFGTRELANGSAFCKKLIEDHGVALVPGIAFGDDRWVRLSYAAADRDLEESMKRITAFVRELG